MNANSMPKIMHFYMDDSGTRNPDRHPGRVPRHGNDWFALGGVLVCMGGYQSGNRPYQRLEEDGKLIDCRLEEQAVSSRGIKYSCRELAAKHTSQES